MTPIARRQQLHQYIDKADNAKIEALFSYIEEGKTAGAITYNKWDDPDFMNAMNRRTKALEEGTNKGYTWEEVKQRPLHFKIFEKYFFSFKVFNLPCRMPFYRFYPNAGLAKLNGVAAFLVV